MRILINSRPVEIAPVAGSLTYEEVCELAHRNPAHNPSVGWSLPNGQGGTLKRGDSAPLIAGVVFEIMASGRA